MYLIWTLVTLLGQKKWTICNLRISWMIHTNSTVCSLLQRSSLAKLEVTNWTISENEGETFSSTSWSRLNVWLSVLHGHQSTHKGTVTRSTSPCQSHTEKRTAPNWKFWLWELYTNVIKNMKSIQTLSMQTQQMQMQQRHTVEREIAAKMKIRWYSCKNF
jgi:hypothetical protein